MHVCRQRCKTWRTSVTDFYPEMNSFAAILLIFSSGTSQVYTPVTPTPCTVHAMEEDCTGTSTSSLKDYSTICTNHMQGHSLQGDTTPLQNHYQLLCTLLDPSSSTMELLLLRTSACYPLSGHLGGTSLEG